jgi:hypothetical protein
MQDLISSKKSPTVDLKSSWLAGFIDAKLIEIIA